MEMILVSNGYNNVDISFTESQYVCLTLLKINADGGSFLPKAKRLNHFWVNTFFFSQLLGPSYFHGLPKRIQITTQWK